MSRSAEDTDIASTVALRLCPAGRRRADPPLAAFLGPGPESGGSSRDASGAGSPGWEVRAQSGRLEGGAGQAELAPS